MSPKAVQYRSGSIIYFSGDKSDKIYILKSGVISLNYKDIETGQDIRDHIKTGEFFGVKSSLGNFLRDETAVVLTDSLVIIFSVPEFEQMVISNTRIIMKMLKVFSNQLRRIHNQVQNLLSKDKQDDPEEGLFHIGEYYMKNQMVSQALYAFNRYQTYYPSGRFSSEATAFIETLGQRLKRSSKGSLSSSLSSNKSKGRAVTPETASYFDYVSMVSQGNYESALKGFTKIVQDGVDLEHVAKAEYEVSRCLFFLERYDEAIGGFTALIKKYPKHPDLKDGLLYIGMAYEGKGIKDKAMGFYKKLLQMASPDEPIYRKVNKAIKKMEVKNVD